MREIKPLNLSGLPLSKEVLASVEAIDWDRVLLDVGTPPCDKCSYIDRISCCGCRDQLEYEKKFEYAESVEKKDVSQSYISTLSTLRELDRNISDVKKEIVDMIRTEHVPPRVLYEYITSALPNDDWSGVIARAVLESLGISGTV